MFIGEWGEFNKELRAQSLSKSLDSQATVALFNVWFNARAEERRMESMGLSNMMGSLQDMLKSTTEQIDQVKKSEEWRGEEH